MGLPTITVEFKKLAATATNRSTRGILAVILQDDTAEWTHKTYTALEEVSEAEFTAANYKALSRAFLAGPWQVTVVRVGGEGSMTDAQTILDNLAYNWVCAVPTAFQAGLVTYIKGINTPAGSARQRPWWLRRNPQMICTSSAWPTRRSPQKGKPRPLIFTNTSPGSLGFWRPAHTDCP